MNHTDDLLDLFACRGSHAFSSAGVTHLQHGWQCSRLSAQAHSTPELQLACWLHDMGHLMGMPALDRPSDDEAGGDADAPRRHEALAASVIEPLFGPAVAGPVALHVAAKRYLVTTQPRYVQILSPDSQRRLRHQGGAMTPREASDFISHPLASDALRLRAWDECAKLPDWRPSSVQTALSELASLMDEVRAQVV